MKLTKHGHSCVTLELEGKKLIIDPGGFTDDLGDIADVVGVVVTHRHADHLNVEHLLKIITANPKVCIFLPEDAADQVEHSRVEVSKQGESQKVGPFDLAFYGEKHALIHGDVPKDKNVAVLVNGEFFHPGDSFTKPDKHVKLLGLPVSGPWLKLGEAIDYALEMKPDACVAIHDHVNSKAGNDVADSIIRGKLGEAGIEYHRLAANESVDI